MKSLPLFAVLLALQPTTALAGFVNNRGQWEGEATAAKRAYLMGAVDYSLMTFQTDPKAVRDAKDRLANCMSDQNIKNDMLPKLVDEAYARDVKIWSRPPALVVVDEIYKICSPRPAVAPTTK